MTEGAASVVSIFHRVDQAAMLERIAESPLEDAEVGFLNDRDPSGQPEHSPSLDAGIRIFSGRDVDDVDRPQPAAHDDVDAEPGPDAHQDGAVSRASFILFGPGGPAARSA